MGMAYSAKEADAVADTTPDWWPYAWTFPTTLWTPEEWPSPDWVNTSWPWPPGWPIDAPAGVTLSVDVSTEVSIDTAATLACRILDAGVDTDELTHHLIGVNAGIGSTRVQMRRSLSDSWSDTLWFAVENYTGIRYGFSETIYFNLSAGDTGSTLTVNCGIATISPPAIGSDTALVVAASSLVAFSASTYSVKDTESTVTITVSRAGSASGALSVDYATSAGTATAGTDYTTTTGTVSWLDGESGDKTFTVPILFDYIVEGDETFTIALSNVVGGTIVSPSSCTVTITDGTARVCSDGDDAAVPANARLHAQRDNPYLNFRSEVISDNPDTLYNARVGKFDNAAIVNRYRQILVLSNMSAAATYTGCQAWLGDFTVIQTLESFVSLDFYLVDSNVDFSNLTRLLCSVPIASLVGTRISLTLDASYLNTKVGNATLYILMVTSVEAADGGVGWGGSGNSSMINGYKFKFENA